MAQKSVQSINTNSKVDVDAELDMIASGNPQMGHKQIVPFGRKAKALPKAGVIINIVFAVLLIIWVIIVLTN